MGINVLSLFDGMSCGCVALERANIKVNQYYASEIDKHAIAVSAANYPEIIRLGDVNNWENWDIDFSTIDLILAGSPCQGFSFAGKQLAFDDPRSALFFRFAEILECVKSLNPNVKFLLENVKMKTEFEKIISKTIGIEPIEINSNLVSAQNRRRLYWCNWNVEQPQDKGILLKDILHEFNSELVSEEHFCNKNWQTWWNKKGSYQLKKKHSNLCLPLGKAITLTARQYADWSGNFNIVEIDNNQYIRRLTPIECERLQTLPDNYTSAASNAQRYKMLGNGWTVDVITHILKGIKSD